MCSEQMMMMMVMMIALETESEWMVMKMLIAAAEETAGSIAMHGCPMNSSLYFAVYFGGWVGWGDVECPCDLRYFQRKPTKFLLEKNAVSVFILH